MFDPFDDDGYLEAMQAKKHRLRNNPTPTEVAHQAEVAIGVLPNNQTEVDRWFRLDQAADNVPA